MIQLRAYRKTDLVQLYELDQVCFAPDIAYSLAELQYFLSNPRSAAWIAETIANDPVGLSAEYRLSGPGESLPSLAESNVRDDSRAGSSSTPDLAGFIIVERATRREGGRGRIITIDVAERMRRLGVGRLLIEFAETRLREEGVSALTLEVAVDNNGALAFYRRLGFSVTGRIPKYYSARLDALVMEKAI